VGHAAPAAWGGAATACFLGLKVAVARQLQSSPACAAIAAWQMRFVQLLRPLEPLPLPPMQQVLVPGMVCWQPASRAAVGRSGTLCRTSLPRGGALPRACHGRAAWHAGMRVVVVGGGGAGGLPVGLFLNANEKALLIPAARGSVLYVWGGNCVPLLWVARSGVSAHALMAMHVLLHPVR
jgi:hypothetical protein